jgi:hypothetical protein
MPNDDIYTSMIQPIGRAYRSSEIDKTKSHYDDPIDHSPGRIAGHSHISGDASPETQSRVIDALIASGERAGLQPHDIAYVLAIARAEAKVKPDAAAPNSVAYGLGQFVKDTGTAYGVNDTNRTDLRTQADLLVAYYQDNANQARERGHGEEYIYKYHHDGPNAEHGGLGLEIGKRDVLPYLDQYEQFVREHQQKYGIEPLGPSTVHHVSPHHGHHHHHHHGSSLHQDPHSPGAANAPQASSTGNSIYDRLHVAINDDCAFSRLCAETAQSPQVLAMEQMGRDILAAQEREEQQRQQAMQQRQGPLMSR